MGKNYYNGGGSKISICDKKKILKKKIYKVIKDNLVSGVISYETIEEYLELYETDELLEILEDVEINYKNRRSQLIAKLTNRNTVTPKKETTETVKKSYQQPLPIFSEEIQAEKIKDKKNKNIFLKKYKMAEEFYDEDEYGEAEIEFEELYLTIGNYDLDEKELDAYKLVIIEKLAELYECSDKLEKTLEKYNELIKLKVNLENNQYKRAHIFKKMEKRWEAEKDQKERENIKEF